MAGRNKYPKSWQPLLSRAGGVFALCDKLGVNQSTLHRWAHDGMKPSVDQLINIRALADNLDVSCPL